MFSYEIQKYGGPEGLKLVDRPLPDPGDREVVVRIKAASLHYRDLVVRGDVALRNDQTFGAIEAYSGAIALGGDSMLPYLRRGETY